MKQPFLESPRDYLAVGAAFVIGFFVNGTARLSGLLFVACLERYHVGREKASVPFIISFTFRNVFSPITGYMGTKFGSKSIVLVGCCLAAAGVGACFFTEDFNVVIISWGVVYGLGFGMGGALVPQILSEHFPHHFDKASGLFLCGSSISGIILPVLGDYSINTYGVSGSFLIFASALLHTIPAAMILAAATTHLRTPKKAVENTVSYRIPERTNVDEDTFKSTRVKDNEDLSFEDPVRYRISENERTELSDDELKSIKDSNDKSSPYLEISLEKPEEIEKYNLALREQAYEPRLKRNGQIEKAESTSSTLPEDKKTALESFGLFLDHTYILMLLTQGVVSYVSVTVWTVVVDVARDHGVKEHNELHVLEDIFERTCNHTMGFSTSWLLCVLFPVF